MNARFLILLVLLIGGCSEFEERELENKNPTKFTFDYSIEKVKEVIHSKFKDYDYRKMGLYFGDNFYPDSLSIFNQKGNENDFCLSTYDDPIGKSHLYFKNGEALDYIASFHLHLERLDSVKTIVNVITLNPRVVVGKKLTPNVHGVRPFDYKPVEPSTIEEYEILTMIGRGLGQRGMPSLIKPEGNTEQK